jgi:intein/homing endonuclease
MNVIRLEMDNGKHITCTPNHLILTINGWEEAQSIKINTEIPWLSIKPHKNIGKDDITYVETTFRETEKDYIEKSGQTTLEKYRKNITYIIKTKIKQTIESIILNVSGGKSTSGIILPIRQTNKERQGEKTQLDYAERVISECLKKKEVCRLKKVTYAGKRDLVYDITVDHLFHGFVANGFIVHNCYDALTYAIQKLEDVRVEKPLNSVEEKLFRMKQQKLHSSEYIVNQRFNQNL